MREAAEASTADPELASEEPAEGPFWRVLPLRDIDVSQDEGAFSSSSDSDPDVGFAHIIIMRSGPRWVGSVKEWQELKLWPIANRIHRLCYGPYVIRQWRRFTRRRRCLRALLALRLYPNGLTREPGVLEHVGRYLF